MTRFTALFIVSVFLVKIPLTIKEIASYEYVLFLSSIVTGWWIHGFIQSFMADSIERDQLSENHRSNNFRKYSKMLLVLGGSILGLSLTCIKILSVYRVLDPPPSGFYYYMVFHFLLQAMVLLVYYFHQKKWTRYIYLSAAYFFFIYLGSFLTLTYDHQMLSEVYKWLMVLATPIPIAWIVLYFKSKSNTLALESKIKTFPHLHLLLIIQSIGFLSLWSDGFWVQYFYGTGEIFALFRYGGREFPLFVILTTTFATAMIHKAKQVTGIRRIRKGSVRFIRLFLPLVITLLVSSQWLYKWVYSDAFRPASIIFDAYLLLTLVRVLFPRPLLIAAEKFKSLLWISIGELLINLFLSLVLYQVWGIIGLVLATLIAHFFELVASLYLVQRKLHIPMNQYLPVRLYLFFALLITFIVTIKYSFFSKDWMSVLMKIPG